jgi:hypothetical protein
MFGIANLSWCSWALSNRRHTVHLVGEVLTNTVKVQSSAISGQAIV